MVLLCVHVTRASTPWDGGLFYVDLSHPNCGQNHEKQTPDKHATIWILLFTPHRGQASNNRLSFRVVNIIHLIASRMRIPCHHKSYKLQYLKPNIYSNIYSLRHYYHYYELKYSHFSLHHRILKRNVDQCSLRVSAVFDGNINLWKIHVRVEGQKTILKLVIMIF